MEDCSTKRDRRIKTVSSYENNDDIHHAPIVSKQHEYPNIVRIHQKVRVPTVVDQTEKTNKRGRPKKIIPSTTNNNLNMSEEYANQIQNGSEEIEPANILSSNNIHHSQDDHIDISEQYTYKGPTRDNIRKDNNNRNNNNGMDIEFDAFAINKNPQNVNSDEIHSEKCKSELADANYSADHHLKVIAEKLRDMRRDGLAVEERELVYREAHRFIMNFSRPEVEGELIHNRKIGQYLKVIYNLLIEINNSDSDAYSLLLASTSILISNIKKQLIKYVQYIYSSTNQR